MKKFVVAFLILIFGSHTLWSQEEVRKTIQGKVTAEAADLEGIYVVNLKTEKTVITKNGGYFTIPAVEGDTLMFTAVEFKGKRMVLTKADLEKDLVFIKMEMIVNQLKEVMIFQHKNINAVSLGIIPKGQKSYTPAERKLKAANGLDFAGNSDGTSGVAFSADPLLNLLSGKTAMLKKELEVERKEFWMEIINQMFDENYFVQKLKIPVDYVKGFEYYIVENNRFIETLKSKNKSMTNFLMGELAVQYNEMIACELE